jgi:hypothetical protein
MEMMMMRNKKFMSLGNGMKNKNEEEIRMDFVVFKCDGSLQSDKSFLF